MHTCELCGAIVDEIYDHEFPNQVVLLICLTCDDELEDREIDILTWNIG